MDLYWVGNTGNWSDNTNHWSTSSGGSPGASKPTSSDNAIIDGSSFNTTGTITVDETANCANLVLSPGYLVSFEGSATVNVYGNLTYGSSIVINLTGVVALKATDTGHTADFAGKVLAHDVEINGIGGGWSLTGNLIIDNDKALIMKAGTLDRNSRTMTIDKLVANSSDTCGIIAGTGNINVTGSSLLAIDLSTATAFSITGTTYKLYTNNECSIKGNASIPIRLELGNNAQITDNSYFSYLKFTANKTYTITNAKTITVDELVASGTAGNLVTLLSASAGNYFTISVPSGMWSFDYMSIKDSHATGSARLYAGANSTSVSGNTGWIFRAAPTFGPFVSSMT